MRGLLIAVALCGFCHGRHVNKVMASMEHGSLPPLSSPLKYETQSIAISKPAELLELDAKTPWKTLNLTTRSVTAMEKRARKGPIEPSIQTFISSSPRRSSDESQIESAAAIVQQISSRPIDRDEPALISIETDVSSRDMLTTNTMDPEKDMGVKEAQEGQEKQGKPWFESNEGLAENKKRLEDRKVKESSSKKENWLLPRFRQKSSVASASSFMPYIYGPQGLAPVMASNGRFMMGGFSPMAMMKQAVHPSQLMMPLVGYGKPKPLKTPLATAEFAPSPQADALNAKLFGDAKLPEGLKIHPSMKQLLKPNVFPAVPAYAQAEAKEGGPNAQVYFGTAPHLPINAINAGLAPGIPHAASYFRDPLNTAPHYSFPHFREVPQRVSDAKE